MTWYLNAALTNFRAAVNRAYPNRDKTSDGTIGDAAHQATNSDHNPDPDGSVDAWDMDTDLHAPEGDSVAIENLKRVFQNHESSRYWIHNRQIASRDINNWQRRYYDGPSAHTEHVHWNTRESHEDSTAPWTIGDDMPTADEVARAVWDIDYVPSYSDDNPTWQGKTVVGYTLDLARKINAQVAELQAQVANQPAAVIDYDKLADALLKRVLGGS